MNFTEKEVIRILHLKAFGKEEGELVSKLAADFLDLEDTVSVSIKIDDEVVANVLFTPFIFTEHPESKCYLLAPFGVSPDYQGTGLGRSLMQKAIDHLKSIGTDAVFVLGVPTFYPRFGFVVTDKETPYPELLKDTESWMVLELKEGTVQNLSGKTMAVKPFMDPIFWDTSEWE